MNWHLLEHESQLDLIVKSSFEIPQILFKHSTRCSISRMALSKTERNWNFAETQVQPYFLDLIAHRNISNKIAEQFQIEHQSPQMLLIKNGKCIFSSTHNDINPTDLNQFLN